MKEIQVIEGEDLKQRLQLQLKKLCTTLHASDKPWLDANSEFFKDRLNPVMQVEYIIEILEVGKHLQQETCNNLKKSLVDLKEAENIIKKFQEKQIASLKLEELELIFKVAEYLLNYTKWEYVALIGKSIMDIAQTAFEYIKFVVKQGYDTACAWDKLGKWWYKFDEAKFRRGARNMVEAICFAKVISLDPEDAAAWNGFGECCLKMDTVEDRKKAFPYFMVACSIDPNNDSALNNSGKCFLEGVGVQKGFHKAFTHFERTVQINPNNVFALNNLGKCYMEGWGVDKDLEKALNYFNKATNINPNYTEARNNADRCREELKPPLIPLQFSQKDILDLKQQFNIGDAQAISKKRPSEKALKENKRNRGPGTN